MKQDAIHALVWSAFPKADEVVVQSMDYGHKIGIGVKLGDYRKGLSFDPKRVNVKRAIRQLKVLIAADAA